MEKNETKNISVKTYAEDAAKAIESAEGGIIKKMIHEEEEKEEQKKNLSPESKKNKLFMFASVVLIVLAFFAIVFIIVFRQKIFTVSVAPQFTPIIFTDQNQFLEIGGLAKDKIIQTVLNEINATKVKAGGVEGIYLTENKKVVGFRKFIAFIEGNLVPEQITFIDDNFLLGIVNNKTTADGGASKDLFILLKMRSMTDIFDGMRAWENKMFYDLHGFWGIDFAPDISYLLTKNFEDGIVENKNARILFNQDGTIALMYVFADDTSVIIADTEEAVHEIMLRLASSQIEK